MLDHADCTTGSETGLPQMLTQLGSGPGAAAYEIRFLDGAGRQLATHLVRCTADKQAAILAHALRPAGARALEVWRGASLVYERPERRRAATLDALRPPALLAAE